MASSSGGPAPAAPTPEFLAAADKHGIAFDPGDLDRLGRFLAALLAANTRFNLTAITDPGQAWMKHVFDGLTLLPWVRQSAPARLIDLGSGGGVPGMVLAACMGDVRFTLLEATGKKARFLEQTAAELGLENVEVINERAETAGHDPKHREQYDVVTARAVGPLQVLLELAVPLARTGGRVLAIKGSAARGEIVAAARALSLLHAAVVATARTPTGTIVAVKKQRPTARRYPRRPGEPKRSPL